MESTKTYGGVEQVGGDHYGKAYGHWDYCKDTHASYLEGNATKYLMRWRDKAGIQDLKKALSYVDKIMVGSEDAIMPPQIAHDNALLHRMLTENHVGDTEALLIFAIFNWQTYQDLQVLRGQLADFINIQEENAAYRKAFAGAEPTSAYTNQGK